ncbi:MAG: methionine--tRNA ligase [Treponema sp.]|nr:methionine--tRNA ligase [Treponema sp.]
MNRKLITSALPYVNNVPHLGNLIQMLSADVFARFCRSRGYDTLYICGTDEYGTATETKALEEHTSPRKLCDHYYKLHTEIYDWFHISCDKFGRTSNKEITEITQEIFANLDANGFIKEHETEQLFCPSCNMFLADRYVRGTCPKCGYEDARGDQCDKCGSLLDPTDLVKPTCHTCGATPHVRKTKHLYIDLPAIAPQLESWMQTASAEGKWSANAIQMTKAWIRDGLNERAITRDLQWGIPVPKPGYEDKVFYVWFDAPIGYISITAQLANELAASGKKSFDYKSWWLPSESNEAKDKAPVELFQFIGKDNIPFHTVVFPCSLLGSGRDWTKLFHMSSTEFLNYEDGKFSKSKGVGVFGTDAKESGIPADAWRFYIFYNRPEKSDYQFTWKDFQEKYNAELIGNLGNLVNRTLLFVNKYYGGKIPAAPVDEALWTQVKAKEQKITELLEWANLKDAFHEIFAITDMGNKAFQAAEPWKTRSTEPEKAAKLIYNLCYVIKDVMIMIFPFLPQYAQKVMSFFGKTIFDSRVDKPCDENSLSWNDLGKLEGLSDIGETSVYFTPMDNKTMLSFREKFSGSQKLRTHDEKAKKQSAKKERLPLAENMAEHFNKYVSLKVAKIISVERNPESDKLYIERLDDGSGNERVIQSGLVPYLKEDELLGKHIILVENLAPRKMRGVESRGMLLAADYTENGEERVELITAPWAEPGTSVILEGADENAAKANEISADVFFQIEIKVRNHAVTIADKKLLVLGKALVTEKTENGEVH